MTLPATSKRAFLHPINHGNKLKLRHFKRIQEGTTQSGIRLQHLEGKSVVGHHYRNGILAEIPGGKTMTVFGSFDEIQDIASQLKRDPDSVFKKLRFVEGSPSGSYYLNRPGPEEVYSQLDIKNPNNQMAQRMYGNADHEVESRPLTKRQEEKQLMAQHRIETDTPPATILTGGSDAA